MSMKPSTKTVSNVMTPVSNDVSQMLVKQITGGTYGSGFGTLQQNAGTAIQKYIDSGGGSLDLSPEWKGLMDITNRNIATGAMDLNRVFGGMGGRFSTGIATAQAKLRSDASSNLAATMGDILRQAFDARQQRLLSAIGGQFDMGQQAMAPFWSASQIGMPNLVVGDSPFAQWSGLLAGAGSLASGGAQTYKLLK